MGNSQLEASQIQIENNQELPTKNKSQKENTQLKHYNTQSQQIETQNPNKKMNSSNSQKQFSKKSLSEIDFALFDQQGVFYSDIYGAINDYSKSKVSPQIQAAVSIFNFEIERNRLQREQEQNKIEQGKANPDQNLLKQSAQNEDNVDINLIRKLQKIGIDVFSYTDMSHHDRHMNIKVRDVIQIYRIFNNLRDSEDDPYDQIKLSKLESFPFFTQDDLSVIKKSCLSYKMKKQSIQINKDVLYSRRASGLQNNDESVSPCNIDLSNRGREGCFCNPNNHQQSIMEDYQSNSASNVNTKQKQKNYKQYQQRNSQYDESVEITDYDQNIPVRKREISKRSTQNNGMVQTQIESNGIETKNGNCGLQMCQSEYTNQMDDQIELQGNKNDNQVIEKKREIQRNNRIAAHQKVSFKQFFEVMVSKLEDSRRLREDVLFEDRERNVSCFLWFY